MNPSTNPSALRSKNEITNSLLHLMEQYPYSEISIKQIILEAQVARKTFYRNFSDKDDVLDAYLTNLMTEYITTLQQLNNCGIVSVLDVIFEFCTLHKSFLILLHKNHLMYLFLDKWNTFIPSVHDQIIDKNSVYYQSCKDLNTDYILAFNIGAVWNTIVTWIEHDMKESPKELKQTISNYLTNMIQFM